MASGTIRVGVGGWDFDPWRGTFYPDGLAKTKQLEYAAGRLTAVEVNSTFYSSQKPATFAKWAAAAPDGFRFALKASRYCVTRKKLADAGESVQRFAEQGLTELGDKLGPILWQFAATRVFDADDIAAFLALLPARQDGVPLRHAIEPRHDSFRDPAFIALARAANAAIVFADSDDYPCIDAATGDFAYARLQRSTEDCATGYDAAGIDGWAKAARGWAEDGRDAYVFFIAGAKVRNPAAATELIARLK
ncbi:DUF72 domain-containing protein [Polymorphobacter fuscus]|uniref:DUF72 domain-containing protein n=1 Tax=Sandarakinorhabdus fusca TaxID=1439888 RepID=A0A7C9GTW9_9SPHN|nr:DUF72 domain-containing protein [Polymorphobacter fuscus]KAB7647429.1 DUF72 domain-containing protein [Polymorphobacter fuscus]MQT16678.1 DUF72 domain-containing protein [Polymorphobacter fuscus]NJC09337.1 uncharacterized protein YecE (DUF72 family) [Polymorphobacter fuscus]